MSTFHLGAEGEAPEPFDPIAALTAEGIPTPEPIGEAVGPVGQETLVVDKKITSADDLIDYVKSQVEEGDTLEIPLSKFSPELLERILAPVHSGEPGYLMTNDKLVTKGINPKDKLGALKPDLSVVPPAASLHLASAMMDGAVKYGAFNWRENKVLGRVYVAAAMRHMLQYLDGEDYDPVSGVHHLGHAMACAAIVLDAKETGNLDDNRPVPGAAGEMIRRWTPDTKLK